MCRDPALMPITRVITHTEHNHTLLKNKKKKTSSLTAIFVLLTLSSVSNSNTFPKAPVRISSALRDADGWCFSCWFQKQACGWGSSQLLRRRAPGATKRWAEALALPAWPQATQTTERHPRNYYRFWLFCYNWFLKKKKKKKENFSAASGWEHDKLITLS